MERLEVELSEYVKKDDYATSSNVGLVKVSVGNGLNINDSGLLSIVFANDKQIDDKLARYVPITPYNLDYAVKKALSDCKLEGDDIWTEEEKAKALELLGGVNVTNVKVGEVANSIVKRGGSGTVSVATPLQNNHATPKKYVDDLVGSVETILTELHTYAESKIGGEA